MRPRPLGPGPAALAVTGALLAIMALSTAPTPLYPGYAARDGLGPFGVTVVFSVFVAGVLAALPTLGRAGDRYGRRPALLGAVGCALAADAVLALPWGPPGLLVGRALSGVAVGTAAPVATVWITELVARAWGEDGRRRWATLTPALSLAGLSLGPLLAGWLAATTSRPLTTPYIALGAALAALLVPLALAPETGAPAHRTGPGASLPPPGVLLAAFGGFSVTGLFGALAPEMLATIDPHPSPAAVGTAVFAVFAAGAAAPAALRRVPPARQIRAGAVAVVLGLAGVWLAVALGAVPCFVVGGVLAGAGGGLLFRGALATALATAHAAGAVFTAAYAGLAVPVLGMGLLLTAVPMTAALTVFTGWTVLLLPLTARRAA